MNRARAGLVVALLGTMAIWGCAQSPGVDTAAVHRLEDEIQTLTTTRNKLQGELKKAQLDISALRQELQLVRDAVKARDSLVTQRTAERDATAAHLESIRKGLRALTEQLDAAAPVNRDPVSANEPRLAGQS